MHFLAFFPWAAKGGLKKLKSAAAREKEYVKNVPVHNSVHQDFSKNAEDSVSNFIMPEYSFESKSALFSTGDGDCLFNSVSMLLVGDESPIFFAIKHKLWTR